MLSQLMGPMSILMPGFGAPLVPPRRPLPPRRAVRAEPQGAELRLVTTAPVPCGAVLLRETAIFLTSAETTTEEMGHGMPMDAMGMDFDESKSCTHVHLGAKPSQYIPIHTA